MLEGPYFRAIKQKITPLKPWGIDGHLSKLITLDLQKFYKKLLSSGGVDRIESKQKNKGSSAKTVRNLQQISPRR